MRVAHGLGSNLLVLDGPQHIRRKIVVCIMKVEAVVIRQDAAYIILASRRQAEEKDQHIVFLSIGISRTRKSLSSNFASWFPSPFAEKGTGGEVNSGIHAGTAS